MTLQQSWLVAELRNEIGELRATVSRKDAELADMRQAARAMLEDMEELAEKADTWDAKECVAHWRGALEARGWTE